MTLESSSLSLRMQIANSVGVNICDVKLPIRAGQSIRSGFNTTPAAIIQIDSLNNSCAILLAVLAASLLPWYGMRRSFELQHPAARLRGALVALMERNCDGRLLSGICGLSQAGGSCNLWSAISSSRSPVF